MKWCMNKNTKKQKKLSSSSIHQGEEEEERRSGLVEFYRRRNLFSLSLWSPLLDCTRSHAHDHATSLRVVKVLLHRPDVSSYEQKRPAKPNESCDPTRVQRSGALGTPPARQQFSLLVFTGRQNS